MKLKFMEWSGERFVFSPPEDALVRFSDKALARFERMVEAGASRDTAATRVARLCYLDVEVL